MKKIIFIAIILAIGGDRLISYMFNNKPVGATKVIMKDGTYVGSTDDNQYESIQVSINVVSGKITDTTTNVTNLNHERSQMIVDSALPSLKDQAIAAQSANIQGVSGASATSQSYINSLQSAIDKASKG